MKKKDENEFVRNLKVGQILDGTMFSVSKIEVKTKKNGDPYICLSLGDKTGYKTAFCWEKNGERIREKTSEIKEGDVITIKGKINEGRDGYPPSIQILNTNDIDLLENEYDITDFKSSTKYDVNVLLAELHKKIEDMTDPHLKELCRHFLTNEGFLKALKEAPGAKSHHHNYSGGLLTHISEVIRICEVVLYFHQDLNRDLLLAGAFLHDVGKIEAYDYKGAAIVLTEKNDLIDHLSLSAMSVKDAINNIRSNGSTFSVELETKLLHVILSHHGEIDLNYGSAVSPQIPEAVILFHADNLDSQTEKAVNEAVV
ncbi:HD domain-containing protein [Candidatus Micrarchaeota archaeon]|nr:HD domain-containing protein [Candidatus Micrarchaeota archaeon]